MRFELNELKSKFSTYIHPKANPSFNWSWQKMKQTRSKFSIALSQSQYPIDQCAYDIKVEKVLSHLFSLQQSP